MAIEKTDAIVLRSVDYSETSKVVTLFSRDFGKISAIAKGARRLRSSFEVALDLLSHCDIGVIRKPNAELDLLTEAVLRERFLGIRRDMESYYTGLYIAEIVDALTMPHETHQRLFEALLIAFGELGDGEDREIVLGRFGLKLFRDLGYELNLEGCTSCGAELMLGGPLSLSLMAGGALCPDCKQGRSDVRTVSSDVHQAMLLEMSGRRSTSQVMGTNRSTSHQIALLVGQYVTYLLGRRPRLASLVFGPKGP